MPFFTGDTPQEFRILLRRIYVLYTAGFALMILLMLTPLGVAMFRSFGLQERIAGNTREKQHAFQAAQSALQFGEWWLTQNNATTGVACSGALATTQVCSNAATMATLTTAPWMIGSTYVPINVNGSSPMTISTTGGVGTGCPGTRFKERLTFSITPLSSCIAVSIHSPRRREGITKNTNAKYINVFFARPSCPSCLRG